MAGQSIQRRQILRILSTAAGVAAFPGFSKWSFACGHAKSLSQIRPATYQPLFFSPSEYALLERLTEIIIPTDDTPGAREAGVSEFIDLMASRDADLQGRLRTGLAWLNSHSKALHGELFIQLAAEKQTAILEPLAYKAKFRESDKTEREFFKTIREYTVMGFYTSEVGLKELDFPGFKFYADSPACPHRDDPEHLHLPRPKW
jgi:gluconate 2-dehydrogenase subunit 3-like protein